MRVPQELLGWEGWQHWLVLPTAWWFGLTVVPLDRACTWLDDHNFPWLHALLWRPRRALFARARRGRMTWWEHTIA